MEDPKDNSIDPAPDRSQVTWTEFLHSQAAVAWDFFTVDTVLLRRYYLLSSSTSKHARCSSLVLPRNPTGAWTTPSSPQPVPPPRRQLDAARALVRDRGSQFIGAFDKIFRAEDFKILRTPVCTPVANAFAERWIGSIRHELLDRTIIWNHRQLERLVVDHIG